MIKSVNSDRWTQSWVFLLIILILFCCATGNSQTIQIAVDHVSTSQYQNYHLAIENCGLGLYNLIQFITINNKTNHIL